ncbi:MAG: hypothetical protein IKS00_00800 [Bacteroidales bacterium]|nr:hypothetical protein [Bacteroidales bacterium]
MNTGICPYPGLRPFTEEESIFFKGRDLHIRQIVKMLEQNKMAFITGASGDGKSSMVYAGVIPYIRAGFSKAEFNSWLIVDFKPQRNTLASLAKSASDALLLPYEQTLTKLSRGFSALVDDYKNSEFYVKEGDDAANRGKNLLIIADQFEEVFTMNENFHNGTPSIDSYTAVNILLETVRLSIEEQLPVYLIFTMRSDYISQCTVFKDLPEFIAYSQFFVPQLKRSEILQVIEQPAELAGGSVSPRLSEVLINNLSSGFDQLPVLQHALNLLWKTAGNGKEQLDLLHFAKIAGISKDLLSDNDRQEFDRWFAKLPEYQKKYYEHPNLDNVLNTHAGTLYESAYDYYLNNSPWADKSITPDESKMIIETAFKTLTKIDNNRQVRNRCTLNEITGIINKPYITNAQVCAVLNIFRTNNNTLIRPFINSDSVDSQYLSGETVLDVTHEALIRNWKMLSAWDEEELENLKEYNDFNTQVQRWLDNGRSPDLLLAPGNYAIFSQWYEKCRPNQYWILKNDTSQRPEDDKLHAAASRMEKCEEYMLQSHDAIIANEKSRRRKIAATICGLLVFIVGLLFFSSWAMKEKDNAEKQTLLAEENAQKAEEQQKAAEQQRSAALSAQMDAQQQRDSVQIMFQQALAAKNESDIARQLAEMMRQDADESRRKAEANYILAERQRDTAERERQNALYQMQLTKEANDSASRLYYVALCNTLAMKAKNKYEDKLLNLRLAKTACEMNLKGGSSQKNADLYDAMLLAMEENRIINPIKLSNSGIKAFTVDNQGRIVTFDNSGEVSFHRIVGGGKSKIESVISDYVGKVPVENAVFATNYLIAYSTKDRSSYLINIDNKRRVTLPSSSNYVKAVSPSPDVAKCVVIYSDGKAAVISTDNGNTLADNDFQTKLTDVYFHKDGVVYLLCHDGRLLKWNYLGGDVKTILPASSLQNAFKVTAIPDKDILVVCYSDGDIQFVNLLSDQKCGTMAGGHSNLENVLYDHSTGILALSSADKRISLVNTNDFNEKPLVIEEHSLGNCKVKCMSFNNKGVLFALTDDNMLRFWDTDPTVYSNSLASMQLAPLSSTEWNLILGREFSEK